MLTAERLRELLHYDPATGRWSWLVSRQCIQAGESAGSRDSDGHRQIKVDGVSYMSGRLAWLYMTGKWSEFHIDHKDVVPDNDRWDNLREATRSQNKANQGARRDSLSGIKGIKFCPKKRTRPYVARIGVRGKRIHLGYFDSSAEAHAAYAKAAEKYFGEFARAA